MGSYRPVSSITLEEEQGERPMTKTEAIHRVIHNLLVHKSLPDLISHKEWKLIEERCQYRPDEATIPSKQIGFFRSKHDSLVLPIHQVCTLNPPWTVIESLIVAHPPGVSSKETAFQRLPIHISCQYGASAESVRTLLTYHPQGARTRDTLGRIPLHYACMVEHQSVDVIDALLADNPEGALCADNKGWLPIHVACRNNAPCAVVEHLLLVSPSCLAAVTDKGSTPLKCAEGNKKDGTNQLDVIKLLKGEKEAHKSDVVQFPTRIIAGSNVPHSRHALSA